MSRPEPTLSMAIHIGVADIKVGERRREEFGDIEGLAESIRKYGLLHPIVTDADDNLIAGERRLRAVRDVLRWEKIPARLYSHLTEDERREIELEENTRRKDLTPYEASRNMVALTETAAKVIEQEFSSIADENLTVKNPKGGRPKKAVTEEKIAERIGTPRATIHNAKAHVAAVSKYPELAVVAPTQKDAITVAKNLDKLDEGERTQARAKLLKHDQNVLANLAEKPPMPPPRARPEKSAGSKWRDWLNETRTRLSSISAMGTHQLTRQWANREYDAFLGELRGFRDDVDRLITDLEEQENELKQQAG